MCYIAHIPFLGSTYSSVHRYREAVCSGRPMPFLESCHLFQSIGSHQRTFGLSIPSDASLSCFQTGDLWTADDLPRFIKPHMGSGSESGAEAPTDRTMNTETWLESWILAGSIFLAEEPMDCCFFSFRKIIACGYMTYGLMLHWYGYPLPPFGQMTYGLKRFNAFY